MWHKVDGYINRAIARVRLAFRAVIADVSTPSGVQFVDGTGLAGEQLEANELFQHYGFTSVPLAGTMAVVLPIGGRTAHGIIVATEHGSYRIKGLKGGEVAIYTDEGDSIILNRNRVMNLTTKTLNINAEDAVNITTKTATIDASTSFTVNTPHMNTSGQMSVDGSVEVTGDVVAGDKSLVDHPHIDSLGGRTTPPLSA
ncbi:phage baseplate assembly protein V [Paraburkholderia unamae]|uniref:Phage baseplate assembly protein V n=1 Tax=Paraburkholderia unamae TaxID=219649 RepID=A0ABX5KKL8_9BURK|nr:phage baseplate assembly protein V [Paraburkholderia unamae]PVX80059.1 phage baseplate assembly protein V [Paraburkholderia unamae]